MGYDHVVIAFFDNETAACKAADSLEDWDNSREDIKLGACGVIVEKTGFDVNLGVNQPEGTMSTIIVLLAVLPSIGAAVAFFCIYQYSLSEEKMVAIRAELEQRRGIS